MNSLRMWLMTVMTSLVGGSIMMTSLVGGSINIKTLPPDLDRAEFSDLGSARSTVNPDWEGQHKAALDGDQGKVWISWTIEQQYITFQVEIKTTGWVGVGLSHGGNVKGADIVMGWVNAAGQATIVDGHSLDGSTIITDPSQDYELVVGFEFSGATVLRYKRKLETCDSDDLAVTNDTLKIIWAYSDLDPVNEKTPSWSEATRSGGRSLHLHMGVSNNQLEPNMKKWVVTSNQMTLPEKETLYWCTLVKLPELSQKHHMVGYQPKIQPGNERFVHHMILYECHDDRPDDVFGPHIDSRYGYECYTPNMPDDFLKCRGIVAAWGLGGESFDFPSDAGYPMGEKHGGATYYMFEVHYENPGLHPNVIDNSGLELILTPHLRPQDSSLLTVGHDVSSLQLIPPGEVSFVTAAHCPAQCTGELPQQGIKVFAGLPHTHLTGTKVRLRHIRNGAELPTPFEDNYFDFNYQTMRRFEFNLMPGDHLITECTYDTSSRSSYTRGGMGTDNEMCIMFLHYYPATNLAHCVSKLPLKNILLAMGVTLWPISAATRKLGLRIRTPEKYQNLTVSDYLVAVLPDDMDAAKRLQEANFHHSQQAECYDFGKRNIYADGAEFSPPRIHTPYYRIDDRCNPFATNDQLFLETFKKHLNQPLQSESASHQQRHEPVRWILLSLVLIVFSFSFSDL